MIVPRRIGTLHGFSGAETDFDFLGVWGGVPKKSLFACPYLREGLRLEGSPGFWDLWRSWFFEWLEDQGITHLIGYSMGGRFILHHLTCADFPKVVRKVVLIGASVPIDSFNERKKRLDQDDRWVQLIKDKGVAVFLEEWKRQPLLASQKNIPEPLKSQLRRSHESRDPRELVFCLERFSPAGMPQQCYEAPFPVAVDYIYGERDLKYKLVAKELKSRYPMMMTHEIENAGHAAHWETPIAFLRFLSSLW